MMAEHLRRLVELNESKQRDSDRPHRYSPEEAACIQFRTNIPYYVRGMFDKKQLLMKLAQSVSVDAIMAEDPAARVACDCVVTTGLILVTGEITTEAYVEIADIARKTVLDIGYDRAKYGFDGETCGVLVSIKEQSADIALWCDEGL